MSEEAQAPTPPTEGPSRVLIAGLVALVVVFGVALVLVLIGQSARPEGTSEAVSVNALENSRNECVVCHSRTTPGIVEQYGHSTMAAAEVKCEDCHQVASDYPGAIEHEGTYVLNTPTTAMCQKCHSAEVAQFNQSRHALPAYVAMWGTETLTDEQFAIWESIPEGRYNPDSPRNVLFALEGEAITKFACETCHNIGAPAPDGSIGKCQDCHIRHEFSLEQARKPETCNACHIGPDHPQWEIYQESSHGILYATDGDNWHWQAEPGTLTVVDMPAPTCATCHISGFGATGTSHDVGERLTWYLFAPISDRRPAWQDNQVRMQGVCQECHNNEFITSFYTAADAATEQVNVWVRESDEIMLPLREQELLTPALFDEPIEYEHYELWHHWGRTAKFGVWMQGADYTQWHGAYEVLNSMAELREAAAHMMEEAENAEAGR